MSTTTISGFDSSSGLSGLNVPLPGWALPCEVSQIYWSRESDPCPETRDCPVSWMVMLWPVADGARVPCELARVCPESATVVAGARVPWDDVSAWPDADTVVAAASVP